jgi:hypothetical protein
MDLKVWYGNIQTQEMKRGRREGKGRKGKGKGITLHSKRVMENLEKAVDIDHLVNA